jgi:hypothetical protein
LRFTEIHVETKKRSELKYPSTGYYLELDIWIPNQNLAFEFQVKRGEGGE